MANRPLPSGTPLARSSASATWISSDCFPDAASRRDDEPRKLAEYQRVFAGVPGLELQSMASLPRPGAQGHPRVWLRLGARARW